MSDYNKRLGAYGEKLAGEFLARRGYKIIARNFQTKLGEIDLIVHKGDELLFVEVKTRTGSGNGFPETAVDWRKTSHLLKAAEIFLTQYSATAWRLDIISVEIDRTAKSARIKWFKDITS